MVIKKYGGFNNPIFNLGDKVIIKYKFSHFYNKTGMILNIINEGMSKGDCLVRIDFSNENVVFYQTNLSRVEEIIEISTGQVYVLYLEDAVDLAMYKYIEYDERGFYYFEEENKWRIENYCL